MTVYIIVLHYKNIEDTIACLDSINKLQINGLNTKVILVDNGSKLKAQSAKLKTTAQNSKLITNDKNLGFAAGVNIGIRETLKDKQTDFVLILNNDTILPPNFLQELLKNPVDITAPVIKFQWNEKWKYDFGGKIDWNIGRTYHLESNSLAMKQFNHETIDYVSGCCMLIKREVFDKIGLFDEKYFFYFEDADFCTRAQKAGFHIRVNPNTYIYHKLGGAIGLWTNKAIFYNLLGNFIFISKNLGWKIPIGYIYLLLLTVKIIFNKIFR